MAINLDFNSVKTICKNSPQVMVYGRLSCKYQQVIEALSDHPDSPVKRVYNYELGASEKPEITLEGRIFSKIDFFSTDDETETTARKCKAGIINLMIENFKRERVNLPLIPLIFCCDIDGSKRILKPQDISARDNKEKIITNSELRLCYKICCELKNHPLLFKISEVANKTIKFVKLVKTNTAYSLKEIEPFWRNPQWKNAWNFRKFTKQHSINTDFLSWRVQLAEIVENLLLTK